MELLQSFLLGLIPLLGLLLGFIVSKCAKEELQDGKKWFLLLRDVFFLLTLGVFLLQWGVIFVVVGVLVSAYLLWLLNESLTTHIVFISSLLVALFSPTQLHLSLLLIISLLDSGVWFATSGFRISIHKITYFISPLLFIGSWFL